MGKRYERVTLRFITRYMMKDYSSEISLKIMALFLVIIIAGIGSWVIFTESDDDYEEGTADWDALLTVSSDSLSPSALSGTGGKPVILVNQDSRFYPLIATPLAVKYSASGMQGVPLLVTGESTSSGVEKFIQMYSLPSSPEGVVIGGRGSINIKPLEMFIDDSIEALSREIASIFWNQSDAVIIIRGDDSGYNQGVVGTVLSSYLDIPVIVSEKKSISSHTADLLESLNVKYSIVFGNVKGYGKVVKFKSVEEIQDLVVEVVRERLGQDINYLALANPLDSVRPEVVDSFSPDDKDYEGIITHSEAAAYPGAAPPIPNDSPEMFFTIPDDYTYANVKFDLRMDVSMVGYDVWNADWSGERVYAYIGVDADHDNVMRGDDDSPEDRLQFFGGSPAYEYIRENPNDPNSKPLTAHFYTEIPFFNDPGEHAVILLAKLPTAYSTDHSSTYEVNIEIEKLEKPQYPLIYDLSSLASYLAAYRGGLVMAKPDYGIYEDVGYIGCASCGEPAANVNLLEAANKEAIEVKRDVNRMLAKLVDLPLDYSGNFETKKEQLMNLAQYFKTRNTNEDYTYLGIISDTNMVPQYYYYSGGQGDPQEGFGIPGDNIYADIDSHETDAPYAIDGNNPSLELAVGRLDGWDSQDVSALMARTFFYDQIIDHYTGHRVKYKGSSELIDLSWKDSAMTSFGTVVPVESAISVTSKLDNMFFDAGLTSDSNRDQQQARRQHQGAVTIPDSPDGALTAINTAYKTYEIYERSNLIMICAHGFYYWYVPTAQESIPSEIGIPIPATSGGSAFDVEHVKNMNFGPSVMFASSCVTGRVDGLQPYNALSLAFLHGGMNAYIGATRSSWGTIAPLPDDQADEAFGDYLAYLMYGYLTGGVCYNKRDFQVIPEVEDVPIGVALMFAKTKYAIKMGTDGGGPHDDTLNEFMLHGDPAFNPYEPNHEG